jgi:hypothetical protein
MPTTRRDVVHGFGTLAIVLDGLRGEISIAELCRREGIERTVHSLLRLVELLGAVLGPVVLSSTPLSRPASTDGFRRYVKWTVASLLEVPLPARF